MRRLALVAGIALSAVAFSPKAQAQTANVNFAGTISPTCSVNGTPTNGTLALEDTSNLATNTPGIINVTCSGSTTFTITAISDNGTTLSSGDYSDAIDSINATIRDVSTEDIVAQGGVSPSNLVSITYPINVPGDAQTGPITGKNYEVSLLVSREGQLPIGTYGIRVSVSLTPQ